MGLLSFAQKIHQWNPDMDISANDEMAFRLACSHGHWEVAQWLLTVNPDLNLSANNNDAFYWACKYGHLEVVKGLFPLLNKYKINKNNMEPWFLVACEEGHHVEVAKWLLHENPELDITTDDDEAFHHACEEGHRLMATWLVSLRPNRYTLNVQQGKKLVYQIYKTQAFFNSSTNSSSWIDYDEQCKKEKEKETIQKVFSNNQKM